MIVLRNSLSIVALLSVVLWIGGCNEKKTPAVTAQISTEPGGEACSIELPGIHFTRSLNGAANSAHIGKEGITIASDATTDYFNEPDGTSGYHSAPILLANVDNTKPFTLTAKVTPTFKATYDAGALYMFSSNQRWQKFAFEMDERGLTRIVSVRTIETSDDNNHEVVSQSSVYLKISSDTHVIGFYFSTDNETWTLARLYKNESPETIWVGISSQSPLGAGNTTEFETCLLTDTAITDFRLGI